MFDCDSTKQNETVRSSTQNFSPPSLPVPGRRKNLSPFFPKPEVNGPSSSSRAPPVSTVYLFCKPINEILPKIVPHFFVLFQLWGVFSRIFAPSPVAYSLQQFTHRISPLIKSICKMGPRLPPLWWKTSNDFEGFYITRPKKRTSKRRLLALLLWIKMSQFFDDFFSSCCPSSHPTDGQWDFFLSFLFHSFADTNRKLLKETEKSNNKKTVENWKTARRQP